MLTVISYQNNDFSNSRLVAHDRKFCLKGKKQKKVHFSQPSLCVFIFTTNEISRICTVLVSHIEESLLTRTSIAKGVTSFSLFLSGFAFYLINLVTYPLYFAPSRHFSDASVSDTVRSRYIPISA